MSTITIEAIEARQHELAELIAKFKAEAAPTTLRLAEAFIALQPGEHYAGLVLDSEGQPSHHLILLPGERDDITWTDACTWAESIGGALPTRSEQALLYANLKDRFAAAWYWSAETHQSDGSCAWGQLFTHGFQNITHKGFEGRARAVRRLAL